MTTRSFLLSISFLLFFYISSAQYGYFASNINGQILFAKRTSDGGTISCGQGGGNAQNSIFITKADSLENTLWLKFFEPQSFFVPISFDKTNDNSYILLTVGYISGIRTPMVIKFDVDGNILFAKTYHLSTNLNMEPNVIGRAAGNDNGFVFSGGDCSVNNYLVKCNSDGDIEWSKEFRPGNPLNAGNLVKVFTDSSFYYGVSTFYNDTTFCTALEKIDINGNPVWQKYYDNGLGQDLPDGIIKASNNKWIIPFRLDQSGSNYNRYMVYYINPDGTLSGTYEIKTNGYAPWAHAYAPTNDSGFIAAGDWNDTTGKSPGQYFIYKMNTAGEFLWSLEPKSTNPNSIQQGYHDFISVGQNKFLAFGNSATDNMTLTVIDENGSGLCSIDALPKITSVALAGVKALNFSLTTSSFIATDSVYNIYSTSIGAGGLAKICGNNSTLSLKEVSKQPVIIDVYPNPASSSVFINDTKSEHLVFMDLLGSVVGSAQTTEGKVTEINITNFPSVFIVKTENGLFRKVIRQ